MFLPFTVNGHDSPIEHTLYCIGLESLYLAYGMLDNTLFAWTSTLITTASFETKSISIRSMRRSTRLFSTFKICEILIPFLGGCEYMKTFDCCVSMLNDFIEAEVYFPSYQASRTIFLFTLSISMLSPIGISAYVPSDATCLTSPL